MQSLNGAFACRRSREPLASEGAMPLSILTLLWVVQREIETMPKLGIDPV